MIFSVMLFSGCGSSTAAKPSSSRQLPVPVALNEEDPTLQHSLYYISWKCQYLFMRFSKKLQP